MPARSPQQGEGPPSRSKGFPLDTSRPPLRARGRFPSFEGGVGKVISIRSKRGAGESILLTSPRWWVIVLGMRERIWGRKRTAAAIILGLVLLLAPGGANRAQQNGSPTRPGADYMRDVLRRNTKPIGLKEDKLLQELLKQSNMKWAIRSSGRHILD